MKKSLRYVTIFLAMILTQFRDNSLELVFGVNTCDLFNDLTIFLKQKGRKMCIRDSFTRSSAANIPVNMKLCRDLNLNPETYSVSIPLGATINMAGAAITINTLTLAAVHTLGIQVDFATAFVLSIVAAVSACGASGVAGGSLLPVSYTHLLLLLRQKIGIQQFRLLLHLCSHLPYHLTSLE